LFWVGQVNDTVFPATKKREKHPFSSFPPLLLDFHHLGLRQRKTRRRWAGGISLAKIRKGAVGAIEALLQEFLTKLRKEKMDWYLPIVRAEYPNYTAVIHYNKEAMERLPAGLTNHELDIALYGIESEWRTNVKRHGLEN
jgi:hypothetical protein